MAIQNINTLKSWFKRGFKPLQQQFYDWMDSYWHKDEQLPISSVSGLENILNTLPSQGAITALLAVFLPELINASADLVYTLKANSRLQSVIIIPSADVTIKIGTSAGGEDVMLETLIQANETFILDCAVYAMTDKPIYISGVSAPTQLLIYKR
ncbi:hypothetical protein A4H97_32190 [Niastella yeongjuensis]|uniref:Uncharacterized protein n=1 Tax=Niastella yeongjuensis TaxID=354355 RepID=A0A1V9EIF0_9BACT|nr:hypothetical protein [Niastella yeongjuensis]OQP45903.1 hypothetical protein A4H97_32190 [Niastella yeongjuensis]SEP46850.1 hypothetical protein SAMN05660816_06520 [Niastella yeongjuensis]